MTFWQILYFIFEQFFYFFLAKPSTFDKITFMSYELDLYLLAKNPSLLG
jgi:hypothetical protein